jgi:tetratricopeptide (TPR) repeat protein
LLLRARDDVAGTGAARVVAIDGRSVARSALLGAFVAELDDELVLRRRFSRHTSSLGLGPLAEVVAGVMRAGGGNDIGRAGTADPWARPALDDLLCRSTEARELGEIYSAVAQLVAARTGPPLVIALDDVHHAGHGFLNFVSYLMAYPGARVLMVCAADPGFAEDAVPGGDVVVLDQPEDGVDLDLDHVAHRDVLDLVAVAGADVTIETVARALGTSEDHALNAVAELAERGLLTRDAGEPFSCPEAIARACYDALEAGARPSVHETVARALAEGFTGRTRPELVGAHFELAGARAEAAEHLGRAGHLSLQRGDMPSAADLLTRAARLLSPGDPERLKATAASLDALLTIGRAGRVGDMARAARAEARDAGDHCMGARFGLWDALMGGVDPGRLGPMLDSLESALASCDDPLGRAQAAEARGHLLWDAGEWRGSVDAMDVALDHARSAGDRPTLSRILVWVLSHALWGREPAHAAIARGEALDWTASWSALVEIKRAAVLAVLHAATGEANAAREHLHRAARIQERVGQPPFVARIPHAAAWMALLADDASAAEDALRPDFDDLLAYGHPAALEGGVLLARALVIQGRAPEALEIARTCGRVAEAAPADELGPTRGEIAAIEARAAARGGRGDVDLESASRDLPPENRPLQRGDTLLDLADAATATGDAERARELCELALVLYDGKGASACAARARKALADLVP